MTHVCIIGNGVAGITAARNIRKLKPASMCRITVISAETDHFFSRTALMYIYMGHMTYEHTKPYEDGFWAKNDIELVRDYVTGINTGNKQLHLRTGVELSYDVLLLATGSSGNRAGWPGEALKGVQGMVTYQDIEAMERHTQDVHQAVIVGGGLIGIEMAECLHARHIPVAFLIREEAYWQGVLPWEEAIMVGRHMRSYGIDLRPNTELQEIKGDSSGRVQAVVTTTGEEIACQFVGVTIGVHPNIDFLEGSGIATDRGILVNEFLETSAPDVYAAGDCAQHQIAPSGRKNIEQIWYSGRMQGETVAQTICGHKTHYIPGVFFNSAKFFDIEYQVYGQVNAQPQEDEEQFYWEHPDGEKAVRIIFEKHGAVRGFNLMGIRYKHAVCDRWLTEKADIGYVMEHLKQANFDPEFHKRHEAEIIDAFQTAYPDRKVRVKKRNRVAALFGW